MNKQEPPEYTSRPAPKPEPSPLLQKTAVEAYGWPEDWRKRLIDTQEHCVFALQVRLVAEATNRGRSGEVKDLAVALAASVDKLGELHSFQAVVPEVWVTSEGAVHFSSMMDDRMMGVIQAAWKSMPSFDPEARPAPPVDLTQPPEAPPADSEARG